MLGEITPSTETTLWLYSEGDESTLQRLAAIDSGCARAETATVKMIISIAALAIELLLLFIFRYSKLGRIENRQVEGGEQALSAFFLFQ